MYRAFFVIMIPVLLVALGYVLVLQHMGIPPGYPRLVIAMAVFFGLIWWLGRRTMRNTKPDVR
jgi:ABC-type spermidine/putrescine transport system permease subunit II